MKSLAIALGVVCMASAAWADAAAGDACAKNLTPDAKRIYEGVVASKPTTSTMQSITESVTRDLAQRNVIDSTRARNNGMAALSCSSAYVK